MSLDLTLAPAAELAKNNDVRFRGESAEYRQARNALLAEEIELRRHIERVAEQRRVLPLGGVVPKDYAFLGVAGPTNLADLFGDKQTLAVYSWMFGPERARPCPMCSSLLASWEGEALDVDRRISLVVTARSPIERMVAFKQERGWQHLRLYSDLAGDFTRDYVSAEDADVPAFNVFTRRDGTIRHFWSGEMSGSTAHPGQAPRARLTLCRYGTFWIPHRKGVGRIGIRLCPTERHSSDDDYRKLPLRKSCVHDRGWPSARIDPLYLFVLLQTRRALCLLRAIEASSDNTRGRQRDLPIEYQKGGPQFLPDVRLRNIQ